MKTTILKLALILLVVGLAIVAGTTTSANDAGLPEALPAPTPRPKINRSANTNANANIAWNADRTMANTAANVSAYDIPFEAPTCTDQPKGANEAFLYFLNAQDILEAADDALVNDHDNRNWKKLRREAVRCLTKAISLDPSNRTYLLKRADVNGDDPLLVIQDITKVIEANPHDTNLYLTRAEAYSNSSEHKLELADYSKAITLEPKNTDIYIKRAMVLEFHIKDKEKALADLNTVLEIDPVHATALSRRADIYLSKKDYVNALEDMDRLIEKDPTNYFYYLSRAEIYEAAGQLTKAVAAANAASKLSPKSYLFYQQRAKLYRRTGQAALALRDERTATRLRAQLMKELEKD